MSEGIKEKILGALFGVMRSICRLLLRHEIGFREFSELTKTAFVQVATEEYGLRGRPTNISRVAVMTGLTRKEVKRIREKKSNLGKDLISKRNPHAELLHYWNTDKEYIDKSGMPIAIEYEGEGPTFQALVKRSAGDIPAGAMRTELKRIGAISERPDGLLTVKTRQHLPMEYHERLINGIEYGLRTLADTVDYNGKPDCEDLRPQKFIHSSEIKEEKLPLITKFLKDRVESFTAETDDLLSTAEAKSESDDKISNVTVGVGVYFYIE